MKIKYVTLSNGYQESVTYYLNGIQENYYLKTKAEPRKINHQLVW